MSELADLGEISKGYGAKSHSGSIGVLKDDEYDQRVKAYKRKRNKGLAQVSATNAAMGAGITGAAGLLTGLRGKALLKPAATWGAASGLGSAGALGGVALLQNRTLRSPKARGNAERLMAHKRSVQP